MLRLLLDAIFFSHLSFETGPFSLIKHVQISNIFSDVIFCIFLKAAVQIPKTVQRHKNAAKTCIASHRQNSEDSLN